MLPNEDEDEPSSKPAASKKPPIKKNQKKVKGKLHRKLDEAKTWKHTN